MTQRLTEERLAGLREDSVSPFVPFDHRADLCDLLAEVDALRAERDEAEQRGRAAERADVVAECERLERYTSPEFAYVTATLRGRFEHGAHVRSPGTPAPGAAKDGM